MSTLSIFHESQAAAALLRELRAVSTAAEETEELSDEDAELVIDSECNLKEAISAALLANAEDEAHVAAIKTVVANLEARSRRKATRIERRRGAIMAAMEMVRRKNLELPTATLSLGNGPCKAIVTDEAMLPRAYMRTPPAVPDLKLILQALKDKQDVPGAVLSNTMPTLRVYPK